VTPSKRKKGFALIYALIFIAAVSSISASYFGVVKNFYDREAELDLEAQYIRVIKEFPPVIEKKLSLINTETDFEYFIANELFYSYNKDNLDINISLKPLNDKIFFADMFDSNGDIKKDYEYVFSQMLDFFGLKYKSFFLSLLQDAADSDQLEREPNSEISKKDRTFQDGPYENFEKLEKIIKYYKEQTGDTTVDAIEWNIFFNFYKKPDNYFVDCKIMPAHIYALFSTYGEEEFYDCESYQNSKNFEKFKKSFNITNFNPKAKYSFLVEVNISKSTTQNLEKKFIYESGSKKITLIR
jgi:hypothetical protein